MGIHLADQTLAFLLACALGAALGAVYDVFRILRVAFPARPGVVFVQDVLYFVLCAVGSFLFLLTNSDGVVRFFLLVGELIGWVLYHYTVGQLVIKVAGAIIDGVKAVLRFVFRYLLLPLWRLVYRIVSLLLRPFRFLARIGKNNVQRLKFRLKVKRVVLYNHFEGSLRRRLQKRAAGKKSKPEKGSMENRDYGCSAEQGDPPKNA